MVANKAHTAPSPDGDEILWGAAAIAAEIGLTSRATFHLLSKGELPARKVGARWVASRARLRAYIVGEG
jgi:hypothetical protein